MKTSKRVVIVGGVAGGMSCATRIKRLDHSVDVTVFERGRDVSYANCGMPYYVGNIIAERASMVVVSPDTLRARYGLDIRVRHEVERIDRDGREVVVRNLDTGESFRQPYEILVLATGAQPLRPPIPGADSPHVHVLNDLAHMDAIHAAAGTATSACVVGGGFIGLELAENLRHRGLNVTVVEMLDQVMPPFDREMTQPLLNELRLNGVDVRLEEVVEAIDDGRVRLKSGQAVDADIVCLCAGVQPRSKLARDAGLELGSRGHIRVDEHMRTSDAAIYAVGDVVETRCFVSATETSLALAGPANRQGRVAADNICGRATAFPGTTGSSIVKVFHVAAGSTGLGEKRLRALGLPFRRVYIHPSQHPRYYPGAHVIHVKLLFAPDGRVLGAQAVGRDGVDSLINVLATAVRARMTVYDLEELELAYSPQWGAAKHAVNMAGFVAANVLRGDVDVVEPDAVPDGLYWLDVRTHAETDAGIVPGATVIPVEEIRDRLGELPRGREIGVYCAVGMRGYVACRFLKQQGYRARNLNGGFTQWRMFHPDRVEMPGSARVTGHRPASESKGSDGPAARACTCGCSSPPAAMVAAPAAPGRRVDASRVVALDACGMQCPGPIVKVGQAIKDMAPGEVLEVRASDPGFAVDIPSWCHRTGNILLEVRPDGKNFVARVRRGTNGLHPVPSAEDVFEEGATAPTTGKTIICFSNDLDRVMAAFIIANGAASMGSKVTIFFTFWGLNVLRRENPPAVAKGLLDRMFGWMMPRGPKRLTLSKMHMGGMGTAMMKHVMKTKNVMTLPELLASAMDSGVRLVACAMSMDVMGIKKEELIDGVELGGVANYLDTADEGRVNLFI